MKQFSQVVATLVFPAVTSTGDVITAVSSNPNAIGYASLASVKDSVKALSVDGVKPSEATVKDGSYAVQRPFVLVTKKDTKLSESAQKFFDYITSKYANEVIGGTGLGLSIVKHAVAYHGGKIKLESTVNIGTTITVCFDN